MPIISPNEVKKIKIQLNFHKVRAVRVNNSHRWWGKTNDLASLRERKSYYRTGSFIEYLAHFGHLAFICCFTFGDLLVEIFVGIFWN